MNHLNSVTSLGRVKQIAHALRMTPSAYEAWLSRTGVRANIEQLRSELSLLFLVAGSAFALAGGVLFVNHCLNDLHRFAKFAILQVAIVAAIGFGWGLGLDRTSGKVLLFTAASLVGLHLAVIWYEYNYVSSLFVLFLVWAVLIFAWVVVGRSTSFLALLAAILNFGVISFSYTVDETPIGPVFDLASVTMIYYLFFDFGNNTLTLFKFALNGTLISLFGALQSRYSYFSNRQLSQAIGLILVSSLASSATYNVVFRGKAGSGLIPLVFLAYAVIGLWYFKYKDKDLFSSAILLLGMIIFLTGTIIKWTTDTGLGLVTLLIIGGLILAQVYAAILWMKSVSTQGATNE